LDRIKPAPLKFCEDVGAVVLIKPAAASDAHAGIQIGADDVIPSTFFRYLRIYIDANVYMRTHVAVSWS